MTTNTYLYTEVIVLISGRERKFVSRGGDVVEVYKKFANTLLKCPPTPGSSE